jgi:hypothetical protein
VEEHANDACWEVEGERMIDVCWGVGEEHGSQSEAEEDRTSLEVVEEGHDGRWAGEEEHQLPSSPRTHMWFFLATVRWGRTKMTFFTYRLCSSH